MKGIKLYIFAFVAVVICVAWYDDFCEYTFKKNKSCTEEFDAEVCNEFYRDKRCPEGTVYWRIAKSAYMCKKL